ncbi:MAG TPA: hypothetical protein VMW66_04135 [Elusimicrobiales bacterium]|nr:hypothetical protein [Elusimicrobiales bacterium]
MNNFENKIKDWCGSIKKHRLNKSLWSSIEPELEAKHLHFKKPALVFALAVCSVIAFLILPLKKEQKPSMYVYVAHSIYDVANYPYLKEQYGDSGPVRLVVGN